LKAWTSLNAWLPGLCSASLALTPISSPAAKRVAAQAVIGGSVSV
jgi:hypothetical protein